MKSFSGLFCRSGRLIIVGLVLFLVGTAGMPLASAGVITDIKVESTGVSAAYYVPLTFGQVFSRGHLFPSGGLVGIFGDSSTTPLQVDVKALHEDGSVRHALISGVVPSVAPGTTQTIQLSTATLGAAGALPTPASLLAGGFSASVNLNLGGVAYSVSLSDLLANATPATWMAGPIANEWIFSAPFRTVVGGLAHPHLTARFAVRPYTGLSRGRLDVVVENSKTFVAGPQNFTYDVNVQLNGQQVYSQAALTHFHHARWRKLFWWGGAEPEVHLKHNAAYLIATQAVSNYDQSIVPAESALAGLATQLTPDKVGPMTLGLTGHYMPATGGRPDIGPLPSWSVLYLLSMDKRAKRAMLASADGSGTWPMHYRDEVTDFPVRLDNAINRNLTTHGNLAHLGPLPVPRCANNNSALCQTYLGGDPQKPIQPDDAHQPSLVYLPYLVTGDYFYLEELQFWAAWNPLGTSPGSRGYELGLVRWTQVRGQAWSLRTMGQAAYITPDTHFLKSYLLGQVNNNLNFYNATYPVANPNQLGVYDGSGASSFISTSGQSAPWQDDFFTWSFGFLAELGFSGAKPILNWKAKYPVGRMTAPGYCWIDGAVYVLNIRPGVGQAVYATFAEAYAATIRNDNMTKEDTGVPMIHPNGWLYLDQPCGSQAQADWLTASMGFTWALGRMRGYADSTTGYPANMQPALAVAANTGITDAKTAWKIFSNRAAKPNYSLSPQWAIVPRPVKLTMPWMSLLLDD